MADEPQPSAPAPSADQSDVEKNKVYAVLAYLGILVLVPLLTAKDSRFAKYHANQGLVLFIADIVVWLAYWVLLFVSPFFVFFFWIVWLGILVLHIIGIVNAAQGQMKPLPIVGGIQLVK
ncbi:hypothetical protein HY441_00580 [Candidatus Microgenomates bacterium]|nr:hypothetical protein [Candidatus Microgenomates bacterium]